MKIATGVSIFFAALSAAYAQTGRPSPIAQTTTAEAEAAASVAVQSRTRLLAIAAPKPTMAASSAQPAQESASVPQR